MQKRAKNEVLGQFLEFGGSDGLDIAYDGITKHSQHMAVAIGHGCIINYVCLECIIMQK